jgi:hypothetical protein
MRKALPQREPERGGVYRDLDGQLVQLVNVTRKLCTWVPVSDNETPQQVTHRDNFLRRFTPLKRSNLKTAA